jgi:hypothetical protein
MVEEIHLQPLYRYVVHVKVYIIASAQWQI